MTSYIHAQRCVARPCSSPKKQESNLLKNTFIVILEEYVILKTYFERDVTRKIILRSLPSL